MEWRAYREAFYGKPPYMYIEDLGSGIKHVLLGEEAEKKWRDDVSLNFKYAWLHHQHRNKHHWQFWCLKEDSGKLLALDMPEKFIREMVADWVGAGYAINGRVEVQDWYAKNSQHMKLSERTKKRVEELLQLFPNGTTL